MIDYYIGTRNSGIIKRITNENGSTHHQIIEENSKDYQAYLAWCAEGGVPTPADENA